MSSEQLPVSRKFHILDSRVPPDESLNPHTNFQVLDRESNREPVYKITEMPQVIRLEQRGLLHKVLESFDNGLIEPNLLGQPLDGMVLRSYLERIRPTIHALLARSENDFLTGLKVKRVLIEALQERLARLTQPERGTSNVSFGVIMTDIDHFKNFNDTHGHEAGDEVLATVAREMSGVLRLGDLAARYGGEEFGFIINGIGTEAEMKAVLSRLHALDLKYTPHGKDPIPITLSMGGFICTPQTAMGRTPKGVLSPADQGLYDVKHGGRNGVSFPSRDGKRRIYLHGEDEEFSSEDIA